MTAERNLMGVPTETLLFSYEVKKVGRGGLRLRHCSYVPRAPGYRGPPNGLLSDSEPFTIDH